jgi:hypothetical protein
MIDVLISHLGEKPLRDLEQPLKSRPGSLRDILNQIEADCPGFRA